MIPEQRSSPSVHLRVHFSCPHRINGLACALQAAPYLGSHAPTTPTQTTPRYKMPDRKVADKTISSFPTDNNKTTRPF